MSFDEEALDGLIELIRRVVKEELRRYHKISGSSLETYRDMKVTAVKNNADGTKTLTADTEDMVTKEVYANVSNKSGEVLAEGDVVRVYETSGGFSSRYIGMKCWDKEGDE